jgi:hypothetical protein
MTFFRMANFTLPFHAKAPMNIKVQLPNSVHGRIGLMRNVVYKEALL